MEEYLTTKELSKRIKMTPGTIRNLVYQKKFIKNVHYFKPTSRKLLFDPSAVEDWLQGSNSDQNAEVTKRSRGLINI
jgi:hypothetical protein